MARCLIGLGSNLGDREQILQSAYAKLDAAGLRVVARSKWHATAPVGGPANQPPFLNAAVAISTDRSPQEVLEQLLRVEQESGRVREERWGARTLDLDLLLYDDVRVSDAQLVVPHPRLAFRRFVLAPAVEIAADWKHPEIDWTLSQLLDHVDQAANYAAIVDTPPADASALCDAVAKDCPCRPIRLDLATTSDQPIDRVRTRIAKATTLLRQLAMPAPHQPWLISDFWIADAMVMAHADGMSSDVIHDLEALIYSSDVPETVPKLLIVPQLSSTDTSFNAAVNEIVPREYSGPVLRVATDNLAQAAAEIRAAMAGMTAVAVTDY